MKHPSLGTFLQNARNKKKLSQWDVAKKLGYTSPQFISNLERDISSPPLKVLKTLVDLYDISTRELLEVIAQEQEKQMKQQMIKLRKALG